VADRLDHRQRATIAIAIAINVEQKSSQLSKWIQCACCVAVSFAWRGRLFVDRRIWAAKTASPSADGTLKTARFTSSSNG